MARGVLPFHEQNPAFVHDGSAVGLSTGDARGRAGGGGAGGDGWQLERLISRATCGICKFALFTWRAAAFPILYARAASKVCPDRVQRFLPPSMPAPVRRICREQH